jgi:hypothetical protein
MRSSAQSPEEYLAELPEDRRIALTEVLNVVRTNLPEGYAEEMQYGHISFYVPHSRYPAGYHCDPSQPLQAVGIASQKSHMALHLFCLYARPNLKAEFMSKYEATGKK